MIKKRSFRLFCARTLKRMQFWISCVVIRCVWCQGEEVMRGGEEGGSSAGGENCANVWYERFIRAGTAEIKLLHGVRGGRQHCRNIQSLWPYFFHSEPSVGINRIPEPGGKTIPWMEPGAEPLSSGLWQTWKSLLSFEPSSALLLPLWAEDFFQISNCQH